MQKKRKHYYTTDQHIGINLQHPNKVWDWQSQTQLDNASVSSSINGALHQFEIQIPLSSLNVKLDVSNSSIIEVYRGKSYKNDPEILGVFKISDPDILRVWKKNGIENPNSYAGESLPIQGNKISTLTIDNDIITEINTPEDYINFLKKN